MKNQYNRIATRSKEPTPRKDRVEAQLTLKYTKIFVFTMA